MTTSHFLIVWDCDARKEAEKLGEELSGLQGVTAVCVREAGEPDRA